MKSLCLTSELQAARDASQSNRVRIVAYTGGVIEPPGWGPVVIDLSGLQLPPSIPILADHENRVGALVGSGSPRVEGSNLIVEGTISDATEAGQTILELLPDQVPIQASVGIDPEETQPVNGDSITVNGRIIESVPGLQIVTRGTLREVSLVPLGADSETFAILVAKRKDYAMTQSDSAILAERERAKTIQSDCDKFLACGLDTAALISLRNQALDGGWTPEQFRARAAELLIAQRPEAPRIGFRTVTPGQRDVLAAAVLRLLGHRELAAKMIGPEAAERADVLRCNTLLDICKAAVQARGEHPTTTDELLRASFSYSDLPVAVGTAAEKIALSVFNEAPRSWEGFARVVTARNFREHVGVRLSAAVRLERVVEKGEITHGTLSEETVTYKVETYARMLTLSRQQILNDDLQLLADLPAVFAKAAARKVSDVLYEVLLGNGGNFFHSSHKNILTGSTSALSINSLGEAIAAMRNQTDADGMPIDVTPRVLLVPPSLEATARQLLNSTQLARDVSSDDQQPMGNPWINALQLAVEPRLESDAFDNSSDSAWYLFGSSQDGAILLAGLNGNLAPTVEQQPADFNKLGMSWRCYIDIGAALGDWRAAVKAAGE